jgi:hypothetical protein
MSATKLIESLIDGGKTPFDLVRELCYGEPNKGLRSLHEEFTMSPAHRKVIDAFIDQESAESNKLSTDGKRLDGLWMGGKNIAYWEGGKIKMGPLDSRSKQTIQHAIKKAAPKNMLSEATWGVGLQGAQMREAAIEKAIQAMAKKYKIGNWQYRQKGHLIDSRGNIYIGVSQNNAFAGNNLQIPDELVNKAKPFVKEAGYGPHNHASNQMIEMNHFAMEKFLASLGLLKVPNESVRENLRESRCELNEDEMALALDGSAEQATQLEELMRALQVAQVPFSAELVEETGELLVSWPQGFTGIVESTLHAMGVEVMEDTGTYEAATFSGEPQGNLPSLFKRNVSKPKKKESAEHLINAVIMGEVSKDELLARFGGKMAAPFKDDNNKGNKKNNKKTNEAEIKVGDIVWDNKYDVAAKVIKDLGSGSFRVTSKDRGAYTQRGSDLLLDFPGKDKVKL